MTRLDTFELPLQRLILSGGPGLAPASGILFRADGQRLVVDGRIGLAFGVSQANSAPIVDDLTDLSGMVFGPEWEARFALVAAWMRWPGFYPTVAYLDLEGEEGDHVRYLNLFAACRGRERRWSFPLRSASYAALLSGSSPADPPALPTYFTAHLPEVALVLALYDVPEVRARVQSA